MRLTISMLKMRSANGWPADASICSRSTITWSRSSRVARGLASVRRWWSAAAYQTRNLIDWLRASSVARCPGVDRASGAGSAFNRCRMLSHDDASPAMRRSFRAQGVSIAGFPVNQETAREAAEGGDFIVFGAPNVVRGGSHTGWTKAADMIAKGLCSILASDYYYPAQLLAAFRLAADGVLPLAEAWDLISAAPARAAGLSDRGVLAEGRRADIILVDDEIPRRPRIVAVIADGRLIHLTDADRLNRHSAVPRKAVAAA